MAQIGPPFEELFLAPHGLDFAPFAALYGLDYHLATDLSAFRSVFAASLARGSASIIEFQTDGREDDRIRRSIVAQVKYQLHAFLEDKPSD